jgi:hypothetical protein
MWQNLISIQALFNVDSVLSQQATSKGEFQYIDTYIVTKINYSGCFITKVGAA